MTKGAHTAWVGLGSNQGDAPGQVRTAVARLTSTPGVTLLKRSSLYRTKPWGDTLQPDFINAVVALRFSGDAFTLLGRLFEIEAALGRKRNGRRWGPRTIDLDLLLFDNYAVESDQLILPHPRMHLRDFVLVPMLEVAPELEIPGRGTVRQCLERLGPVGAERLHVAW